MVETYLSVIFFFIIFCFLTYSCMWFGRNVRRYQGEMQRQQRAQTHPDYRISVFTVDENPQRHVINYNTGRPFKAHELPPDYAEAIRMYAASIPQEPPQYSIAENNASTSTLQQNNNVPARRNSASI